MQTLQRSHGAVEDGIGQEDLTYSLHGVRNPECLEVIEVRFLRCDSRSTKVLKIDEQEERDCLPHADNKHGPVSTKLFGASKEGQSNPAERYFNRAEDDEQSVRRHRRVLLQAGYSSLCPPAMSFVFSTISRRFRSRSDRSGGRSAAGCCRSWGPEVGVLGLVVPASCCACHMSNLKRGTGEDQQGGGGQHELLHNLGCPLNNLLWCLQAGLTLRGEERYVHSSKLSSKPYNAMNYRGHTR